jgi:hypothetical protein
MCPFRILVPVPRHGSVLRPDASLRPRSGWREARRRLGVVEGSLQYGHMLHRADVAEHHGGVALQHRQLRPLHRRPAEGRAVRASRRAVVV